MPVSEDTLWRGPVLRTLQGVLGRSFHLHRPAVQTPQPGGPLSGRPKQDTKYIHFPWRPRSPVQALDKYWISLQQLRERYILKLQICFMNKQSLGTDFLNGASQVAQWYRSIVLVAQPCLTLCDPMNYNPSGSSAHGILQVRILEWVAVPFSRGSSQPRD